jgi:hypothetical protein
LAEDMAALGSWLKTSRYANGFRHGEQSATGCA